MTAPPLKCITLHRPWPWAIAVHGKDIENRTWPCPLTEGSLLGIHAGKAWDNSAEEFIDSIPSANLLPMLDEISPESHKIGIVAIARFLGNVQESRSPWFTGPWGWRIELLAEWIDRPVPCRGQQGLWVPSEDVIEVCRDRWNEQKNRAR